MLFTAYKPPGTANLYEALLSGDVINVERVYVSIATIERSTAPPRATGEWWVTTLSHHPPFVPRILREDTLIGI